MKKRLLSIFLVLFMVFTMMPVSAESVITENLLLNPGGEVYSNYGLLSDNGWKEDASTKRGYSYDAFLNTNGITLAPKSGTYFMGFYAVGSTTYPDGVSCYQDINVSDQTVYNLSGYLSVKKDTTGSAMLQLEALDSSGNPTKLAEQSVKAEDGDWKSVILSGAIPTSTAKLRVIIKGVLNNAGLAAFDDLALTLSGVTTPTTYTVTYKPGANGVGIGASDTKTHDEALTLKGSIFTREGFIQTGWATSDGGGKVYDLGGSYTANATIDLYPVWTANTYTVIYTAGANGTISGNTAQTVSHGGNGTIVNATPNSGYHFVSWSDGVSTKSRTDMNVMGNISVTANFAADTYTVTYKPGTNGVGIGDSDTKTHDETLTLKGSIFTREGFIQAGWATSDGGEKVYDIGGNYTTNANIDLYPVWTINNNKITTTLTFEDSTSTQDCTSTSFHSNHIHADGKKCWSWNADNKTLTLDGINLEMSNDSGEGIRLVSDNAVITLTEGSVNTIATNGSAWYPIRTWDNLTINGNGKLIAMNTTGGNNHAISVDDDLIIDGAEVIATHNGCTKAATDACGISARNITIQGNSKVTASGDSGISAYQSLIIKSGIVMGMGLEFCGISANTLTLEGGNVTSNGGPISDAIWGDTVNILGGTVTATAASGKRPFNQEPTLTGMIHKDGTGTWNNTEGTTCNYEEGATLTYRSGANGSISGSTSQKISRGGNGTTVTATPKPGYHFVSWSDGVLTASRTDVNVMESISVTANFEPDTYTVTYKPGTNAIGSEAYDTKIHDVSLTLKEAIFTREGFTQTGWATSDGGGKVYDLSGSYSANTVVELYPVWTVNSNKITTTLTFEDSTTTQDCTSTTFHINHIHADGKKCWSWNADNKTLTLDGIDLEMSSVDGKGIELKANNAVITLTDGSVNTIATSGLAGYTISNTTNLKITGSGKLTVENTTGKNNSALFSNGELVIDGAEVIVTHNSCTEDKSNSCGITAMNMTIQGNSKVTASGDHGIFVYRNLTMKYGTLTGTGLKVSGITAGQTLTIEGGNMTSNGGPKSVSVYGPTIKLLGGTVMSTAAIGQQPFSTEPTLSGLIHKYGTGTWYNISGTTCVYEKGATYTLTYTAGANGTITGNGAQTVSHGGNGSIVTATPNPGYHFVSWSDGVLTASRTEKNVMGSISVTANFAADTYTITLNANGGNALTPATLITGANGKLTSLPVSTRSGSYSFKGWFTEASGGTAVTTDTVFSADATIYAHWTYTGGSGSGTSTTAPTPSFTIKGEVIYSGEAVNGINAQVTNSNDGTKVISFKSQEAIMEKKVDGTTQAFSNFNKVGFTAAVGTTSSINMSGDGTIQIKDLINGTKSTFNMIFHMGESQNIVIGKINVKVDENGEISLSSTLIDPYGVIIDPSTGEPITGVQVTLYYADTARNKMNGKAPNTPVELPLLDGFKPNDNKNPQVSDESGSYAFMVYPTSDYYIIATKEGYETYKSMTISVEQEIVKWDFKMNKPLIGTKRLAGESRVDTGLSIAKANYSTKLKNVVLAAASNYPDALAGSVLAYKLNAPILLVGSTDMEQNKVIDYMKSNLNSAGTVYILGGTGAVGLEIENKISEAGFNNITRISGKNRSETALKITDFLEVPIGRPLILVNEGNYADALSVSTSAAAAQSPILLIGKDGLTAEVKQKIAEIKPIKIYLIGGEGVISTKVASQVAEITDLDQENIIRIGGKDRYDTSLAVAKYFGLSGKNACLATGRNFPDALAGSVYAANYNAPVILVGNSIPQETKEYLISQKMSGVVIFGGEGVIGKEIEGEILKLLVSE